MDCAADPDAFKASLEASRTALAKLSPDAKDISTYMTETIKPILKTIREQLEAQKTGTTQ